MRVPDHDRRQDCRVIPFAKPLASENAKLTSSTFAGVALTNLNREGESPRERLLDIIDASGEEEALDIMDVIEKHETLGCSPRPLLRSDNENEIVMLL